MQPAQNIPRRRNWSWLVLIISFILIALCFAHLVYMGLTGKTVIGDEVNGGLITLVIAVPSVFIFFNRLSILRPPRFRSNGEQSVP